MVSSTLESCLQRYNLPTEAVPPPPPGEEADLGMGVGVAGGLASQGAMFQAVQAPAGLAMAGKNPQPIPPRTLILTLTRNPTTGLRAMPRP